MSYIYSKFEGKLEKPLPTRQDIHNLIRCELKIANPSADELKELKDDVTKKLRKKSLEAKKKSNAILWRLFYLYISFVTVFLVADLLWIITAEPLFHLDYYVVEYDATAFKTFMTFCLIITAVVYLATFGFATKTICEANRVDTISHLELEVTLDLLNEEINRRSHYFLSPTSQENPSRTNLYKRNP